MDWRKIDEIIYKEIKNKGSASTADLISYLSKQIEGLSKEEYSLLTRRSTYNLKKQEKIVSPFKGHFIISDIEKEFGSKDVTQVSGDENFIKMWMKATGKIWFYRGNTIERVFGNNIQLGGLTKVYVIGESRNAELKENAKKHNIEIIFIRNLDFKELVNFSINKLFMTKDFNHNEIEKIIEGISKSDCLIYNHKEKYVEMLIEPEFIIKSLFLNEKTSGKNEWMYKKTNERKALRLMKNVEKLKGVLNGREIY